MNKPIYVTRPYLPPLEETIERITAIYQRAILTNGGPEEQELEGRMKKLLEVSNFIYVTNGTVALQLAIRALGLEPGEIITTPFTYVATTSAILWEGFEPVYVDIVPRTYNIDPAKIETAITSRTRAILPVHVFGHPCDTEAIEQIAARHHLPVIYDAAHAFGVCKDGMSIARFGTISAFSFHATKPFHTLEGGACVTKSPELAKKLELLKRFGHTLDDHQLLGINAKQDEINAAFGNMNLNHLSEIFETRRKAWELYYSRLKDTFQLRQIDKGVDYNYAYFPVVFDTEEELLKIMHVLKDNKVYPRRYFYPSLTKLPYHGRNDSCPIAEDISIRIICLPLFSSLEDDEILHICEILNKTRK